MLFNTKFDLVISLGEDCACSSYLRRCRLQDFSYPFDWLTNAPLSSRFDLMLNNFKDFLNFQDLYPIEKPKEGLTDTLCDYWAEKRYNFWFFHDFRTGIPIEEEYKNVKARFDRRIKRLYEQISESDKILFVWWSRGRHQNIEMLQDYYEKFVYKFQDKSIYFLIIEYGEVQETTYLKDNHILISKYDNISWKHNKKWNETMGNCANNMALFRQIKMKRNYKYYTKLISYYFLKIFVEIIPFKPLRSSLRAKLKSNFYRDKL